MKHRVDPAAIADAILNAPGWARVGITAPTSIMREDAAREMARYISDCMEITGAPAAHGQGHLKL